MATVKVTLDKRKDHITKDNKFALVLRIGHKSKTRDISFNIHLHADQFDPDTGKITGITNSVRHSKRTKKIYGDIDLWIDEEAGTIRHWEIDQLKREIEQRFFKKQPSRTLLNYGGVYLHRLLLEGQYATADSYESALKIWVKYRMKLKGEDDQTIIKTLYKKEANALTVLADYTAYDMQIRAFDYSFGKDFKAYMSKRFASKNTPLIHLRSIQAIMNDAAQAFADLQGHNPLSRIEKQSVENVPKPLTLEEIGAIRHLELTPHTPIWNTRNYLLFMFNNMGMNHFDMAIIKRSQFDGERITYFRKKTLKEGDYFSVLQSEESLTIISHYLNDQAPDDYLFPIIPNDATPERLHRVNKDKVKLFNKYANRIAELAEIDKKITTYTIRDTWTNIGLDLGIDIRKISSGLGHSGVHVTEKHYAQKIQTQILDEINAKITKPLNS
ncbi:tyrosine-type recombinase/integrase [Aquimarina macrocephali]|uniref:tyrosine-type recombinase/integrase n=1 Tax=Aquimarina macrocephali TaxID=666563 RepID=UPI000467A65C|nr:tyrosine-type recombinase/integrase [Aquimarina macrocephali]